jgi:hypothetical protein
MFCKPDVSDILKPDVLKPDILKPDVLWVYQQKSLYEICGQKDDNKIKNQTNLNHQRRYDMNGIFQMLGGKNWILPK